MEHETSKLVQQMLIFLSVIQQGGFTHAAEKLNIAKSTVSKQVRALEHYFGVRLLHRESRKISLTEEGRTILPFCEQMVRSSNDACMAVEQLKENINGTLKVTAPPGISDFLVKNCLSEFLEKLPSLALNLNVSESLQPIIENELDIAIRVGETEQSQFVSRKLGEMHAQLYASPSYIDTYGSPTHIEELHSHNCLIWEISTGKPLKEWQLFEKQSPVLINVHGNFISNSITTLKSAAIRGLGIAPFASIVVEQELKEGKLIKVLPEYSSKPLPIYALYSQRLSLPPKAKAFLELVRESLKSQLS